MQFKPSKGALQLVMHKTDVEQLLNATYLLEMVPRNLPGYSMSADLTAAIDTVRKFVAKEGARHLDEHGCVKRSERRKASDESVPESSTVSPSFGSGDGT